jgi:putative molybdopterin biosynthesis protein
MEHIQRIKQYQDLKVLSDERRLKILRLLMSKPATLSQLGVQLGEHPARVRHHLKALEAAGLVELVETRLVRGFVEKYYQARARAFLLHDLILPDLLDREVVPVLGSHDMALEKLAGYLRNQDAGAIELMVLPVGSLEGLIALRQGAAQIAGCHLLDTASGEYNLPHVRHLFPDRQVKIFTLAHRTQGLILPQGNPKNVQGLGDLRRSDIRFINRNPGSGTRTWLDSQLEKDGILGSAVQGYTKSVRTHTQVAQAVHGGDVDTGLGIEAAALLFDLDFLPLFQERFDLVISGENIGDHRLLPIFERLESARFRREVDGLGGYDTAQTGDQIYL